MSAPRRSWVFGRRATEWMLLAFVFLTSAGHARAQPPGSPSDPAGLVERLQSPAAAVRATAACELGRLAHGATLPIAPLVAALADDRPTPAVRCRIEGQMGRWARDFAGRELDTSEWPPTSPAREAARALIRGDDGIVAPVLSALRDPDATVRKYAAWILGRREDTRAVTPLIARLSDDDMTVRVYVVEALGQIEDTAAVQPLSSMLADPASRVREESARALGRQESSAAVAPLVRALRDPDARVRTATARALGQIEDPVPVPVLAALVDDQDAGVREATVVALGHIPGAPATDALLDAATHEDPRIRARALRALGRR